MTKNEIKEIMKQVWKEEQDYQQLFKTMLSKSGKDIKSMSDEEKKKFFSAVDKIYKAKSEGNLINYSKQNKLNESFIASFAIWFTTILLGKMVFFWLLELINPNLVKTTIKTKDIDEKMISNIFQELSSDKFFIEDVAEVVKKNNGLDNSAAEKIVKFSAVQRNIKSALGKDATPIKIKKIEDALIQIFVKTFNNTSIMNKITTKVKSEIK
jgi:hypothetical protein